MPPGSRIASSRNHAPDARCSVRGYLSAWAQPPSSAGSVCAGSSAGSVCVSVLAQGLTALAMRPDRCLPTLHDGRLRRGGLNIRPLLMRARTQTPSTTSRHDVNELSVPASRGTQLRVGQAARLQTPEVFEPACGRDRTRVTGERVYKNIKQQNGLEKRAG